MMWNKYIDVLQTVFLSLTGLATSDRLVRVLLRDIAGKACWDASALYYDPSTTITEALEHLALPDTVDSPRDNTLSSLPPPLPPTLLPDFKNSPPDKHQLDHVSICDHLSERLVLNVYITCHCKQYLKKIIKAFKYTVLN